MKPFYAAFAVASLMGASYAHGQDMDIDSQVNALNAKRPHVLVAVAAGPSDGANWKVISDIASQITDPTVDLAPKSSSGSLISSLAACKGITEAAIVGRDAATYRAHLFDSAAPTGCAGKYAVLSKGLFPYYVYAVVRKDTPYSEFSSMIDHADPTKPWKIAAGNEGSGARVVLHNLIESHPQWRRSIAWDNDGGVGALQLLASEEVDMVFVLDAHNSAYINRQVAGNVDAKGNPKFKVIAVDPYSKFWDTSDSQHRHLYQQVTISGGWFSSVKTVATDGIMIVNKEWWGSHQQAVNAIGRAMDTATAAILSDTGTDPGWKPAIDN